MHSLLTYDYQLFGILNSWTRWGAFFDWLVVFLARDLVVFVGAGLILYWFFGNDKFVTRKSLIMGFLSFVFSRVVLVEIIRLFLHRDRPFISHTVVQLLEKGNQASFPSGHMTAMAAIASAVYFYHPRLGLWLWVMGLVIGVSRVIVGVHYPIDIVGGIAVGWISSYILQKWVAPRMDRAVYVISRFSDKIYSYK